jgi:hypothetical protein
VWEHERDEGLTRTYSGTRLPNGKTSVRVDGEPLDTRMNFRKEASSTFDWGYSGRGGPAQLALAILADYFEDDERARRHYQDFVRRVIRGWPSEGWTLTGAEIDAFFPTLAVSVGSAT